MKRRLQSQEKALLKKMLGSTGDQETRFLEKLDSILVQEMDDGGMGSLRFIDQDQEARNLGDTIAEVEFLDEDGVLVTAVLNLDQQGELYELDVWKVDFSPLRSWPDIGQITIKNSS
ncbi:MAG: hypothetical protein KDH90_25915 [Anaerolineae bacterium]|nr:hypothetical protein [Anaerolineae bacterium]MCB0232517.1 hypothetical protein [Anaerolineae bacterium]